MTLLPSFDPGTATRAPLAGAGDPASAAQPDAGAGQTQGFAALLGQAPDSATTPTLPDAPQAAEGATDASDTLPDVLAQMLHPASGATAQFGTPAAAGAEVPAETPPDDPLDGMPDAGQPDTLAAPATSLMARLPDGVQAITWAAPPSPQPPHGGQGAPLGATGPRVPGRTPPIPVPATPAPLLGGPSPAPGATVTGPTGTAPADRTPAEKTAGKTFLGAPGTGSDATGRALTVADSAQQHVAPAPGIETAPLKADALPTLAPEALPLTDAARPVSLSISLAPAPAPAPTTATAAPVIPTARADWPLDLAAELAASASLRSLGAGGLLEIRLDPDALGPVTLRLEVTDGTAHVAIVTQTPEAARLFTENQHRLAEALSRAGLDLGQHSAGTGGQTGQQGRERPADTPAQPGPTLTEALSITTQAGAAPRGRRIDLIA